MPGLYIIPAIIHPLVVDLPSQSIIESEYSLLRYIITDGKQKAAIRGVGKNIH